MLPVELWKHIALQYVEGGQLSPKVYMVLSLVSSKFIMCTTILQEYYLRKIATRIGIEYGLPNGNLHSPDYGKLPAVIHANGYQVWCVNGNRHRDEGLPAVIADGYQGWYHHGKRHRGDGLPALIRANGDQVWYVHGNRHRDGGLPAAIWAGGDREWYRHGKRHRDNDLPAKISRGGRQEWWINGERHRDNRQPVVVWTND